MTQEQSFAAGAGGGLAQGAKVAVNVSLSCVRLPHGRRCAEADVFGWVQRLPTWACAASRCATPRAWPTPAGAPATAAQSALAGVEFTLHFHNTRGMGLANVLAAIDAGADRFDASLGGWAVAPTRRAPAAMCSEEIVHALDCMGYDTGVDLAQLVAAAQQLPAPIGHDIPARSPRPGRAWPCTGPGRL